MYKLSYKEIQTIQESTTKKLVKYINDFIKKDNSLESIEFYYPDFDDEKTMIAFNVWVSIDYRTHYGKSFIEHMLEEKPHSLTRLEKEILKERNKSYVSLFEIQKIKGEFVHILDLLTRKKHKIWEPSLSTILKKSDLIFGRIGTIIEYKGFIGNISFLPYSVKDMFIEEVLLDYNHIRLKFPELTINKYLKQYSVNIYKIYTECIYDIIEIDEDAASTLYDELEEFESYLSLHVSRPKIKKHINNLINLFEYYFMEEEMTLYDLDQIDIEDLINVAIDDGFVSSQSELSSYISTLKKYLGFLKNKSPIYKEPYEKILEISKNRFLYLNNIKYANTPFDIDINIANAITHILNEQAFDFIMDYEKFLLYLMNEPLEVTKKRKYIKRKHLLELNEMMENKETITRKTPNQENFRMIHLFYQFSIDNKIIRYSKELLVPTKKLSQYLRLNDGEKYSLFLQYIWSDKFLSYTNSSFNSNSLESNRENIINLLSNLEENVDYKYSCLLPACLEFPEFLLSYYKYLELLGLLKYNYHPKLTISITPFGKKVFNTLSTDEINTNGKIIELIKYQEK